MSLSNPRILPLPGGSAANVLKRTRTRTDNFLVHTPLLSTSCGRCNATLLIHFPPRRLLTSLLLHPSPRRRRFQVLSLPYFHAEYSTSHPYRPCFDIEPISISTFSSFWGGPLVYYTVCIALYIYSSELILLALVTIVLSVIGQSNFNNR